MGPFLKKSHLLVQDKLTFSLANNYENSHARCILFTSIILMCMFFLVKKYAICSWFEVLIIRKITSLILIFSFYIAICSQTLRIILHQHKKKTFTQSKTFLKTHQIDNMLRLHVWNIHLFQKGNHNLFYSAKSTDLKTCLNEQKQGRLKTNKFYR